MNVPDDWGSYYYKCEYCGSRYHASEGGCGCLEDAGQCAGCQNRYHYGMSRAEAEGWHPLDELTEVDGRLYCEEHLACECCEEETEGLGWCEEAEMLLCPRCTDADHWCPAQGPLLDHIASKVSDE